MHDALDSEFLSTARRDQGDRQAHCFTWENPEHTDCEHKLAETVAVTADKTKLAVCEYCSLLTALKATRPRPQTRGSNDE